MKRWIKPLILLITVVAGFAAYGQENLLTIQDAVRLAIEKNFDVQIAKNTVEIGVINNNWGMAGALPTVSATANENLGTNNLRQKLNTGTIIEKNGNNSSNFAAGVQVNWKVFDGLKMFATKRRLEELKSMGETTFRKVINETSYNVIATYYNIVTLKEQQKATLEQIKLYEDRLQLAKAKLDIGTGAKYEVLEAEVDMNEQKSNLLSLQNAISIAKSSLSNLISNHPDTSFAIVDTILVKPLPLLTEAQEKIALQNPDLMLANSSIKVLFENKNEIKAAQLPSVNLTGNYNFNKSSSSAGFTLFNQTYGPSGGIGVSIPIFQGGVVNRQLQVVDINIRNQQLALDKLKAEILTSLNNAYISYDNARKIIELETNNIKTATENIKIATERYKKLNITAIELRQIQISYNAVKYRLFNALNQAKSAEAMVALLTADLQDL